MTELLSTPLAPDARLAAFAATDTVEGAVPGANTVGYVSLNVPVELIEAAGCVPRRLTPRRHATLPHADRFLDACFDGAARALFEQFLRGDYAAYDLVVMPRTSENGLQLYYFLLEAQRLEPQLAIPPLHLFDLLQTPYRSTARYVRDQVERLKSRLEALSGRAIEADAVARAIRDANAHLARFDALTALRHAQPARMSGAAALQIVDALGKMPRAQHVAALDALLAERNALPAHDGPRLVVKGSAHDSDAFYRVVEACGAVIVGDEHLGGQLAVGGEFDSGLAPLDAIAHRYQLRSPSLRRYPQAGDDARFIEAIQAAHAHGVIFWYEANDDVLGWDYPDQKAALDALGVPSLRLLEQPYGEVPNAEVRAQVAAFIDALRPGAQPVGAVR
ncbi:2-hydroxyacyl-CoA dehydratase subunit D [Paraburkholderia acidisoli]|uniref:2-hydroxyacyl-CoA dehydratase n=1 Tax=Paraburkholderia acidisoli TaxID=2571748 RepID=A0A7Z2GK69_9BURK|nr:2-hydroxyacyl-CoA dehydratase family protein [Paraburkholderia acidisoli]QGZ63333.1 hypothetical protein FAZ98_16165 [Paraburkholderia acidisoli]